MRCLIVGGDGLLGTAARKRFVDAGADCYFTSRRSSAGKSDHCLPLDMMESGSFEPPIVPELVLLLAGMTGMLQCKQDPENTYAVNVTGTVALAEKFMNKGAFVIFPSTSAVFDGETASPGEESPISYTTEYGRQKAIAEQRLLALDTSASRIAIVRLTKVVASNMSPFTSFIRHLNDGTRFEAFSDLMLSPISIPYVLDAFIEIYRRRIGGLLHLSGETEVSYADFVRKIAGVKRLDHKLVTAVHSSEKGINLLYKPRHATLGMKSTSKRLGVNPEPLTLSVTRM